MILENRRSGLDRRDQKITVTIDMRREAERREIVRDSNRIISIMKATPVFKGLFIDQYSKIVHISSQQSYYKDYSIYQKGEESNELFILIEGHCKVLSEEDNVLTEISPIGVIGEIGVFTGKPRSATVITTADSTVIRISKTELFKLFLNDGVLSSHILLNVIYYLAQQIEEKKRS